MLDMKYLRKNVTEVTQKLQDRGVSPDNLIELLNLDQERRDTIQKVEILKQTETLHLIKLHMLSVIKKMPVNLFWRCKELVKKSKN